MEGLASLPAGLDLPLAPESDAAAAQGVYDLRGLLRAEGDDLLLDVRAVGTRGEGEVTTHRIPLALVSSVDFVRGWLGTRLEIRPRMLAAFDGVPGVTDDVLVLRVARRDRALASQWATALSFALLERGTD